MNRPSIDDEFPVDDFASSPLTDQYKKITVKDRARAILKSPRNRFGLFMLGFFVVVGYLVFGGRSASDQPVGISEMKDVPRLNSQAGGNIQATSPEVARALVEDDKARAQKALSSGESFIPNMSTGKIEASGPVDRSSRLDFERTTTPDVTIRPRQDVPSPMPVLASSSPAELSAQREAVEIASRERQARGAAMQAQLSQMTSAWVPQAPATTMYVQPVVAQASQQRSSTAATQSGGQVAQQPTPPTNLVPPLAKTGSIWYARIETSTSTVKPGPILARIVSGPLAGGRIIGQGSKADDGIVVRFDRLALPDELGGKTVPFDALAIDAETSENAIASEVYHGYFERYGLGLAAAFIEGYGEAIAQNGSVSVTSGGSAVTVRDPLDPGDRLLVAGGKVGQKIGEEMAAIAGSGRYPIVYLHQGQPVGVLLMADMPDPRLPTR
jgi:intracellular multiplication protein IcmE